VEEAMLWHKERNGVRCDLCNWHCFISKDKKGVCQVRLNKDNRLYSLNYGKIISMNVDPIEKKPFFHFHPGAKTFSIAAPGCNFRCQFCFEPMTRVLTNEGLVTLEKLFDKGKRSVLKDGFVSFLDGYTAVTHNGKDSKITKVYRHFHDGELIKIKPYHLPELKSTPSHEFFVYDKEDKKIKKIPAGKIGKNHLLVVPKSSELNGHAARRIDFKEILSSHHTEYRKKTKVDEEKAREILMLHNAGKTSREIGKIFKMHPTYIRKLIGKLKRQGISKDLIYEENAIVERGELIKFRMEKTFVRRFISLDEDFAALLGYYCAKGHVTTSKKRINSHNCVFSFGKCETDLIEKTKGLIKKIFGLKAKTVKRKTTITVEFGKSSIALLFKILAGDNSYNKNVPKIILECKNKKIVHSFLKAYFEGDGHRQKDALEYVTCSEDMAYNTFLLLLKLGLVPSFYKFVPAEKGVIEDRTVNQSPFFRVKIHGEELINSFLDGFDIKKIPLNKGSRFFEDGNYFFVPIREISCEKYAGFVYNLEVEDEDHSYLSNFVSVSNCCNAELSQGIHETPIEKMKIPEHTPEEIVKLADKNNCRIISYTYSEPTIFFEFAFKTAKLASRDNLFNTFVTNGYMTDEAVKKFKYLDAATVDVKASLDPEFYKKFIGVPKPETILKTLKQMKKQRIHIEITNLIVPQFGDSVEMCKKFAEWVNAEISPEVPFHLLQFFPSYKLLDLPATPIATLEKCADVAKKAGLRYVYIGNVPGHHDESTYCYNCSEPLIVRKGMQLKKMNLVDDRCPNCGVRINVVVK